MYKFVIVMLLATVSTVTLAQSGQTTQTSASPAPEKGFLSYIDFGGSANSDGHVFTLGFSAGYQFNRHVIVSTRVPVYFASATGTASSGTSSGTSAASQQTTYSNNGVGDPSLALQLNFPNRIMDYQTRVTTWIPVADTSSGFSTGDVLVDWTNRISRRMGRLVPYGQIDIANTVPDTPAFTLPYTAQGTNARFEGGTNVELTKIFSVGASFYDVLPSGEQHVYSRMGMAGQSGSGMSGANGAMGAGNGGGNSFMLNPVTVGNDLTRDHGVSTWLAASLSNYVDMQVGYTHSYGYDLDTVSFGIGFNVGEALRHHRANE